VHWSWWELEEVVRPRIDLNVKVFMWQTWYNCNEPYPVGYMFAIVVQFFLFVLSKPFIKHNDIWLKSNISE
jgi:hypothetical protein